MNIAIIGTGYVGLVTAACFAQTGQHVLCFDKDLRKITMLRGGTVPFHEPGLEALVVEGQASGHLAFRSSLRAGEGLERADVIFLAIGTPTGPDGRADLDDLLDCAGRLARILTRDALVVVKSTAPVGTCQRIQDVLDAQSPHTPRPRFVVASNPEFLAEARAVADFQHPERIVIGCEDEDACRVLQEARWLVRNVEQRYATIQRVAEAIVLRQRRFFDYGDVALRPLMLREVAEDLDIHESTVSRATANKYMITPRGLFEFRHFFSRELGTEAGGSCSANAVRALIRELIDAENPAQPLSDVDLRQQLTRHGIVMARRTVTKYRGQLKIPAVELRRTHG
ncbi:hypothetical protein [Castellaniella sp. S9]|uniref:RNA polymerase factor sigma-54 n=1 Tax=Castellaniella sp. S9 TaxID=2993652 RepID=UPI003FA473D7